MRKKFFVLLVILMSLSLIGIIFVQAWFINNSLTNEEKQFTLNVKRSLSLVSKAIEDKEFQYYSSKMMELIKDGGVSDSVKLREMIVKYRDEDRNETTIYRNIISEESFKVPSLFFEIGLDSVNVSRLFNRRETMVFNENNLDGNLSVKPEETIVEYSALDEVAKKLFEQGYRQYYKNYPVYKRVETDEVQQLLKDELNAEGINIDFEFAIYDKDLATKVQSDNFDLNKYTNYGVPIFLDNNNQSDFNLIVNFPDRTKFLFSNLIWLIVLSIFFTTIIIVAYSNAVYQLIKQKQISQIKTDFINNMTHEFKTPIATINLALDAIKNPKIIDDKEKVLRYMQMIRDENKRMHAQVENVLRISKLEKNELNISKERLKLHDIIDAAVSHVDLIVEDRQGYIKKHYNAAKSSVLANDTYFTSVIVNILDNAIKYTEGQPEIDIYTENIGNNIILKIADKGIGMSKQVQKRVFEKFYREHTGNVHNVKGHGLGLAYVKQIVDDHQGHVSVESEKGKGSVFTIKLPLIS